MALAPGVTKAVLMLAGERCRYCGKAATTADHIVPQRVNGKDAASNLVAACQSCNSKKGGARLPPETERELLIEAWIVADEVEKLARMFRFSQQPATTRPTLDFRRDPDDRWRLL